MIGRTVDTPSALVLGLSPTGLIAARSLGRRGVPVFGAEFNHWGIAGFSRYCTHLRNLSAVSQLRKGPALRDALIEFSKTQRERPALFIANDEYIELLSPHFEDLRAHFRFSTDLSGHGASILNKKSFYELCRKKGVELPATHFPKTLEDIDRIAGEIRYPALIKPVYIHRFYKALKGKKVVEVANAKELRRQYTRLAKVENQLIVQEVVPGPDELIYVAAYYLDAESRPKAVFVGRKLRQYPPRFGSACLAESRWDPEVASISLQFLQSIRFRGICGTEFKRDPRDGRLKMMEVNPRMTLWMGLTRAVGVDVPLIAYQDLTGAEVAPSKQVDGVKWTYRLKDIRSALYYLRVRELSLGAWWRSLRGCSEEAIFARDDFHLGLFIPAYAAARMLRRVQ